MKPRLTNGGNSALLSLIGGGGELEFTRIALGDGNAPADYLEATGLTSEVAEATINGCTHQGSYVRLTAAYTNSSLVASFPFREVGIFCRDPEDETQEVLYAYGHHSLDGKPNPEVTVPASGGEVFEIDLSYSIYVSDLEDVTAVIDQETGVSVADFEAHTGDHDNPHAVTKAQVGLGLVENLAFSDNMTVFSEPQSLSVPLSGESAGTVFGKLALATRNLRQHITDAGLHVSTAERASWNGKADGAHVHGSEDVTAGFSVAGTITALVSGESLRVSLGKIARAVLALKSHVEATGLHVGGSTVATVQETAVYLGIDLSD